MGCLTPANVSTCPAGLKVYWHVAGPAVATDCITFYRRSLLTMSLAVAAALIVRGVPTEHRPSKTSMATAVAVVMRWKLSTMVAMSAAMTVTTLVI